MKFIQIDAAILDDGYVSNNANGGGDERSIRVITNWVRNYLSKPHSKLGRSGPVCPFTPPAVKLGQVWVAVAPASATTVESLVDLSWEGKEFFQQAPENESESKYYKATLILFPHLNTAQGHAVIESTQQQLKPIFVAEGLMFGQFYQGCPEPGLLNPDFRPLFSPIPLLAIRYMVPQDIAFLKHDPELMEHYYFHTAETKLSEDECIS